MAKHTISKYKALYAGLGLLFVFAWVSIFWYWNQPTEYTTSCVVDRSTCYLSINDNRIAQLEIAITDDGNVQPILIQLVEQPASGISIKRASVKLVGINEYMGVNIYPLKQQPQTMPAVFHYMGVLPGCTVAEMRWNASIHLITSSGSFTSQMEFTSRRIT